VTGRRPTSTSSTSNPGSGADTPGARDPSSSRPPLLEIGRIAKAHGLAGQVVVDLITNRIERLEQGAHLSTSSGADLVVASSRPFGDRWIVAFEGVGDRPGADRIRGNQLFAAPIEEPEGLWVDELVGSAVFDQDGNLLGKVAALIANPASDLLELEDGGLVPLVFVVRQSPGRVVVDIPDGLLE